MLGCVFLDSLTQVTAQTVCAPVPGGLVGWWRADDNTLAFFGGNDGTLAGNVSYVAGVVGDAFSFDGNHSGVILSNRSELHLQDFTIEAWVQRGSVTQASLDSNGGEIFSCGSGGYLFALKDDGRLFLSRIDFSEVISDLAITDLAWHHVGLTRRGANVVFYLDGIGSTASPFGDTFAFNSPLAIGARGDNLANSFIGSIDEIAVYNQPLPPADMLAIYNSGNSGKCVDTSAPVIDQQPSNQTGIAGTNVVFSVFASGSPPLSYQWQFQTTNISGATNYSLSLGNVQVANVGEYRAVVTNTSGSVTSEVATFTLQRPPVINQQPQSVSVAPGSSAQFTVAVTGDQPFTFQWSLNGTNLTNATNYSLLLTNVQMPDAGVYRVEITNSSGSATSTGAVLTVVFPPAITNQPQGVVLPIGANFRLSVGASGTPPFTYQWKVGNVNIPRATNAFFGINEIQTTNVGVYTVAISNAFGQIVSDGASLAVTNPVCAPMPPGLVGWWQGEGNTLDAVSGDSAGLIGNTTNITAKVGRGFAFDGNGDALRISNSAALQLQDFTIEAWVKRGTNNRASFTAGGGIILGFGGGGYAFAFLDDGHPFLTQIGVSQLNASFQVTDTNWHHLAVSKATTDVVFFLDGVAFSSPTSFSSVFSFNSQAAIGARGDTSANSFIGTIDELSVFNRALSTSEIQTIYFSTVQGKCGYPLAWLVQPTNQLTAIGSNLQFSAVAKGSRPIQYQWFQNGAAIPQATNSLLSLQNVGFFQAGDYSVAATNAVGNILSTNATLIVRSLSLLANGSFESGDFTGWIVDDISSPLNAVAIHGSGYNSGFGFFSSQPSDGGFCLTHGFDGNGPGRIQVAVDVVLPTAPTTLTFDYRAAWDMLNYGGSTQPRTLGLVIEPYGGGQGLQTNILLTASPGTANYDTGILHGTVDLSAFAGQGLRLSFDATIPEAFTGPGFFQLDKVILTYPPVPPLLIGKSGTNVVLWWPSMFTNFAPVMASNLISSPLWAEVNTNIIVRGATNNSFTQPIGPGKVYFRLRSQ